MRRLLLLSTLLLFTCSAFAQMGGGGMRQMTAEEQAASIKASVDALNNAVTLTDAEKTRAEAIFKETNDKTQALRNDATLDRQVMMERITAIREEQNKKLNELLGEERFKRYQEVVPQQGIGGGGGGGGQRPQQGI